MINVEGRLSIRNEAKHKILESQTKQMVYIVYIDIMNYIILSEQYRTVLWNMFIFQLYYPITYPSNAGSKVLVTSNKLYILIHTLYLSIKLQGITHQKTIIIESVAFLSKRCMNSSSLILKFCWDKQIQWFGKVMLPAFWNKFLILGNGKGKAIPVTGCEGP
jgi:uncharacterized protein YhhL (DUF1145 family)